MNSDSEMFTKEQVKDIISHISYEDILSEEDVLSIIRMVMSVYKNGREDKTPECLLRIALYNAVDMGIQKYYEIIGE